MAISSLPEGLSESLELHVAVEVPSIESESTAIMAVEALLSGLVGESKEAHLACAGTDDMLSILGP